MAKVLLIEDDLNVFNMLKSVLNPSFEIVRARAVDEAMGAVEEEGPFDCFVVDLSILSSGLTLEEMAMYKRREGYAFLKNYLWKGRLNNYKWEADNPDAVKLLKSKTIICSRYTPDFSSEFGDEVDDLKMVIKDKGFEKRVALLIEKICS